MEGMPRRKKKGSKNAEPFKKGGNKMVRRFGSPSRRVGNRTNATREKSSRYYSIQLKPRLRELEFLCAQEGSKK